MPEKPKDTRPSAAKRGYDFRWQKARKRYLATHPLCVYCKRYQGRVRVATCIDHIVPHKGDRALFWDTENWAASCKQCNDVKGDRSVEEAFGR